MSERITISTVIPTYGRPDSLTECLESIYWQTYKPIEVVVVGVATDQLTEQAVERFRQRLGPDDDSCVLRYLKSEVKGAVPQRNLGIRTVRGELISIIDDDCILEVGYYEAMANFYQANRHRNIVGMAGMITNESEKRSPTLSMVIGRMTFLGALLSLFKPQLRRESRDAIMAPWFYNSDAPVRILFAPGGNTLYCRSFITTELFDPFFQGYALGEDVEMSFRALKRGDLYYVPRARMLHKKIAIARESEDSIGRKEIRNILHIYGTHCKPYGMRGLIMVSTIIIYMLMLNACSWMRKPYDWARLKRIRGTVFEIIVQLYVRLNNVKQ